MNYTPASLKLFANTVLQSFGCQKGEAEIVSDHLVEANLAGHDSHGVGMLPMYGAQVKDGNLVPNQTPDFVQRNGAVSVVDAKQGFGHRMTLLALDHAMETVSAYGVAVLALRNSGHISRVGTYSEYCAARGYASIHMVNVVGHEPIVAPFGAREGGFSTNPVSMAMPVDGKAEPLLDMATSTVAFGKVRVASNKGEKVAPGWVIDGEGLETTDPDPMAQHKIGALSAFGNHKGSGMGIFAELMAGALAGTNTIDTAANFPNGVLNNMLSIIMYPGSFDDPASVQERAQGFNQSIRAKQPAKGLSEVLLPGDPENISRSKRAVEGVPVDDETIRQIMEISDRFGLDGSTVAKLLVKV
ncbi:MAG: malate/lactate/ureidoglycolate dehydrogenase [Rhizobiaceae bacterium]